ncbi:MAG: hypothetical protein A3F82_05050 [Deltaproteobacteria bacterium RIFCSPLOWO2_12_FULL_44_12]|nr:MAG: hypothetical protein A2712_06100 [Deltaproteobacteria bacterium RIFCSPHIGHO2_01_FULL_43_49]OGQ16700.1 MAG: hypothetical protein A3D22_07225 [Deltaproteobacteria bacterium RIFCSPHIGHO2_02_FULL_44_53]OGQ29838.1 MAG: hypothetical protein A3D98_09890 [Deltaproteobacteria bacterium RIFCSPHIGHO2_12_FULL_44_21]OGQ33128.1 MAG: hypothetical protein A2979_03870 [Deltaproteobacteria bacterium RIFCSPLOWO2_01_FULL_45_74]OGQ42223.1 MAG: hypothetical protein A3I70_06175 [Deltaproteobacteria bacterium 
MESNRRNSLTQAADNIKERFEKVVGGPECLLWGLVRGPHKNTEGQPACRRPRDPLLSHNILYG